MHCDLSSNSLINMSKSRRSSILTSNKEKSSKSVEPSNSKSSKESKSKKISSNSKLLPDEQGYESESLLDVETLRETRRSILAVERLSLNSKGNVMYRINKYQKAVRF